MDAGSDFNYSYFKYRFAVIVFIMHEFMSWCWSWISVSQSLLWSRRLMPWSHHYVVQYLRMYGHIWDHFLDESASTFYTSTPPMCQNVLTSFHTAFSVGAFCTIFSCFVDLCNGARDKGWCELVKTDEQRHISTDFCEGHKRRSWEATEPGFSLFCVICIP